MGSREDDTLTTMTPDSRQNPGMPPAEAEGHESPTLDEQLTAYLKARNLSVMADTARTISACINLLLIYEPQGPGWDDNDVSQLLLRAARYSLSHWGTPLFGDFSLHTNSRMPTKEEDWPGPEEPHFLLRGREVRSVHLALLGGLDNWRGIIEGPELGEMNPYLLHLMSSALCGYLPGIEKFLDHPTGTSMAHGTVAVSPLDLARGLQDEEIIVQCISDRWIDDH